MTIPRNLLISGKRVNAWNRVSSTFADLLRPSKRQGAQAAARAAKRERRLQSYRQRYYQRLSKQLIRQSKLEHEIEVHRQEQARVDSA